MYKNLQQKFLFIINEIIKENFKLELVYTILKKETLLFMVTELIKEEYEN